MTRTGALVLVGAFTSLVHAQITNSDCRPVPVDGATLCIPKFCPAPSNFRTSAWAGYTAKTATTAESWNTYMFKAELNNVELNATIDPASYPNLQGYNLEVICKTVTYSNPSPPTSTPAGPPPPLYSVAGPDTPTGCAAISPLPTIVHSMDLDLIAVWVILIIYLFYALAMVCEEFLVPAINIVCEKTGIPDDVAGATLLAAGCNSPEFFSSIIGIFVADSTVGVGTVIGSAPFNLCCITAGSSLAVGGLLLDPWLMGRELLGLFFALWLFLIFMDDYLVQWWEALIMVLYYLFIYVPTLGYFNQIKASILGCVLGSSAPGEVADAASSKLALDYAVSGKTGMSERTTGQMMSATSVPPPMSGLRGSIAASLSNSIAASAKVEYPIKEALRETAAASLPHHRASVQDGNETELRTIAPVLDYSEGGIKSSMSGAPGNKSLRGTVNQSMGHSPEEADPEGPSAMTDHERLVAECRKRIDGYPNASEGFSGVLMKKPRGFTKVQVRGIQWQSRYFVLDNHPTNPLRYSHENQKTKFVTVPLQYVSDIYRVGQDELWMTMDTHRDDTSIIKLRLPLNTPPDVMQRWFDQLIVKIDDLGHAAPPAALLAGEEEEDEHGEHGPWYKMPEHAGTLSQVMFVMTFPVKAVVFLTTPNVLDKRYAKYYILTIVIAAVWLAIFAILMTDVIEYFGCGIGVDSTVMGLSLGAIGTSFPNLYASILVAKSGQGGMAICQAIASNTFNVCICLGLLWLIHTIGLGHCDYGSHGFLGGYGPCNGCYAPSGFGPLCPFWQGTNNEFGSSAGSTKGAVLVSFFWMIFFIGTLVVCRMRVGKVPAIIMFVAYVIYIVYQFAAAFGKFQLCIGPVNICF